MPPNLEVVVGTYEQFVLGYTIDDIVNKYKMEQSFATHSHLASIRSVASKRHYLASAAADDTICLYDMRSRTENGKLVHHNDTVNSISFTPDASHIITASSDGTIGIVRCGNWQVEKHWLTPHKGLSVDTLAVHPTGKIAMTTGHDGVLRTWNLVKGRQAYATNLVPRWKLDAKNISVLKWSPDGSSYLVAANNRADIYSIETAGIQEELSFDSKVVCAEYLSGEFIAIGLANGKISLHDLENGEKQEIKAHDARVKCMDTNGDLLVSASSSGEIKLWSFKQSSLKLLNRVNCNCRISCLTLTSCQRSNTQKDEKDEEEKIPQVSANRLRTKQHVVVELDDEEDRINESTKKNKRARKSIENSNVEIEKVLKTKETKTDIRKGLFKKKKLEESKLEEEEEGVKKKKKIEKFSKKRKKFLEVNDEISESSNKKKKKQNLNSSQKVGVENNQEGVIKSKRKIPQETVQNSPKKQKLSQVKSVVSKKKKKNNFKNKIPR